jgi:hypothetical protein
MQHQSTSITAERIGQDEVGPGFEVVAMDGSDHLRTLDVGELRAAADFETSRKQGCAHGAIGHDGGTVGEDGFEH